MQIVMENLNHLNQSNEAIPEVNLVVPEPNQVVDIHDPNEMVDIPDDIDLVDYDEEDPEEEPEEDVDIKIEDDAELIFPYEVEGDKTPPPRDVSFDSVSSDSESEDEEVDVAPEATVGTITQRPYAIRDFLRGLFEGDKTPPHRDVSSDSVSSDSESEDEEVDVAPEATAGTITQRPYAIRDFLRGLFEVGESSSARDSSHAHGLAPWTLRRDLEVSRAQARVMEAELGTCQTEIALLKFKNKIREKERELLHHDLENVERALGNVLERVSVLESGENATLKKRFAKTETKLAWARMERDTGERRLHESRVWNKRFYLDMCSEAASSDDEDTEHPRKKSKNSTSDGTSGAGAGGAGAGGAGAGGAGAGGARAGGAGAGSDGPGGAGPGARVGGAGLAAPKITGCTY
ncbi:hypothetical protein Tco_1511636, partial [Tanacetum coccineum]